MGPIGGETPKFVTVAEGGDEARVLLAIANPHLVPIGEVAVEVRDGKVHITTSGPAALEFVVDNGEGR